MRIIKCVNCGKEDEHHSKGLCFNCYRKLAWKRKEKICKGCQKLKYLHAKGYCEYCYNKTFYTEYSRFASRKQYSGITKETFDQLDKRCLICGFDKIVDIHHLVERSKGGSNELSNLIMLCPNHHKMLHHADYRHEILGIISEKMSKVHSKDML
jgi:5-methylcytosine-specific restriction endonuclease McrA